jgi:hypothetical protein
MSGPVIGAALVVGIRNYFAELGAWVTMIQGAIFVIVVMAFRRGIVGELIPLLHARFGTTAEPTTAPTAAQAMADGERSGSSDVPLASAAVGLALKTKDGEA